MSEKSLYDLGLKYHTLKPQVTVLAEGPAELVQVIVADNSATDLILLYDNVVTSDPSTLIAVIVAGVGAPKNFKYNIPLKRGLAINPALLAGSVTVVYR